MKKEKKRKTYTKNKTSLVSFGKKSIGILSKEHIYRKGDTVEFTWLGSLTIGKVVDLTESQTVSNETVATYTIKSLQNTTVYPCIGVNNNMKFGNIVRKIDDITKDK